MKLLGILAAMAVVTTNAAWAHPFGVQKCTSIDPVQGGSMELKFGVTRAGSTVKVTYLDWENQTHVFHGTRFDWEETDTYTLNRSVQLKVWSEEVPVWEKNCGRGACRALPPPVMVTKHYAKLIQVGSELNFQCGYEN